MLKKANLMSLAKQVSDNNRNVKTQVVVTSDDSLEEVSVEPL